MAVDHSNPIPTVTSRSLISFRRYMELIRFSHTIFALPFALLASCWAWVVPVSNELADAGSGPSEIAFRLRDLIGILLCMVFARSFAMAVNRLVDAKFDGENPRTASRHLPAGLLKRSQVTLFTAACAIGFVLSCTVFLPNRLPLLLCVPVLVFLAGYSLAKRFTQLVHYWLGAALMLAPICAWIAIRGEVVGESPTDLLPAVGIGLVVFFWVSGFDIIYACQDAEFDREKGLFSIPAKLGVRGALRVAQASHLAMWLAAMGMTFVFPQLSLGWIFRGTLLGVGGLLIFEHSVVSERSLAKVQLAFFQLNSIISIVFLAAGSLDAVLR